MTRNKGRIVAVQTVQGPVPAANLGLTLTHEHLYADFSSYVWQPPQPWKAELARQPAGAQIAWALREDPFFHPDNCRLDDVDATVAELEPFLAASGRTVIDVTNAGMGRDPGRLVEIAERTGLNVVMGSTWYVGATHDERVRAQTVGDLADELLHEVLHGVGETGIRPGVLGELGISADMTDSEERCLRAAARVQLRTGLPLIVHLPGWDRLGSRVLDIIEEEGAAPSSVVLGHMNPSGVDPDYQAQLASRGAWLGYDMVGMGFYYADHGGQAPSPHDDAAAVARLITEGFGDRILLSHDVFVKAMWTRNGGNGFAYIPRLFLPRLVGRHGIAPDVASALLTDNPARLFESAWRAKGDN
ncbi:phosphotriesterase [Cellulomonas fimi]|uniref:phosphotriesterase family protein n=1 Tax=Cellulomonas fimi TaxID=1708 RepID=UPI001B869DA0|nr:phosphotriesterase-related protein [Cellulomonas fimi]